MKVLFVIGRAIFGGFFLYSGVNHFLKREAMTGYARSKGMPMPDVANAVAGVALVIGGASVILGLEPKIGTAAIAAFLASASPTIHNFWTHKDPGQQQNEMIHFSKNTALFGAALALMALREPWPASISRH